jgi:hypothetical protein
MGWQRGRDRLPVEGHERRPRGAGGRQSQHDEEEQCQHRGSTLEQCEQSGGHERDRGRDQHEAEKERPEPVARIGAQQRSSDQVGQERPEDRVRDQERGPPALRSGRGRLGEEDRGQEPADHGREQQQADDRTDRILSCGEGLHLLQLEWTVQLGRRRGEERHKHRLRVEAPRIHPQQPVAALAGDVGAIDLRLVDRIHRIGLVGIRDVLERDRVTRDLLRLGRRDHRRVAGHAQGHVLREQHLERADRTEREHALQDDDQRERAHDLLPRKAAWLDALVLTRPILD